MGATRLDTTAKNRQLSDKPAGPRRSRRSRRGRPRKVSHAELAVISIAWPGVTSDRHRRRLAFAVRALAALEGVPGVAPYFDLDGARRGTVELPMGTLAALGAVPPGDLPAMARAVNDRRPATDAEGLRLLRQFQAMLRKARREGEL